MDPKIPPFLGVSKTDVFETYFDGAPFGGLVYSLTGEYPIPGRLDEFLRPVGHAFTGRQREQGLERGQIEGQEAAANLAKVAAKVPLGEMFGYATNIRSNTQGRGIFSMEFSHYDEVPRNVAEAIVTKNKGR